MVISKNKKRGFTLIELLAVILILAVVSLIAVPIVGNIINEVKKTAYKQSAIGLVESANNYYASYLAGSEQDIVFQFSSGVQTSEQKLEYKGQVDGSGSVRLFSDGTVTMCIDNNKYYATKSASSDKIISGDGTCGEYDQDAGSYAVIELVSKAQLDLLQEQIASLQDQISQLQTEKSQLVEQYQNNQMCHLLMSSAGIGASYSASSNVVTYATLYENVELKGYTTLELFGTVSGYGTQTGYGSSQIYIYDSHNQVVFSKTIGQTSGAGASYTLQLGEVIQLPNTFVEDETYIIKIAASISKPTEGYTCYRNTNVSKSVLY